MKELAVVTGANRGIGLEFCKQLKDKNFDVIACCRKISNELQKLKVEVIEGLDVSKENSYSRLSDDLKDRKIDLLINNAGIFRSDSVNDLKAAPLLEQMETNATGPLVFTSFLSEWLSDEARVAMITSRMVSIEDNSSGGYYGYRMSKAALNAGSKSLSIDWKSSGRVVLILHPGYVKTDMTSQSGEITPEVSVSGMLKVILNSKKEDSGVFFHTNGERLPW